MVKFGLALAALLLLFVVGVWSIAIPEATILTLIGNSLSDSPLDIECDGFRKSLLFGFSADKITIKKDSRPLVVITGFSGQAALSALARLQLPFTFSGTIGGGSLQGTAELLRKSREVTITVTEAEMAMVPFFELAGLKGSGRVSGTLLLQNSKGGVKFDLKEMRVPQAAFGNISVPLNYFQSAQGALELDGGSAKVNSFTMEGPGIYARVKGDITGGRLALTLEIMPEKAFADKNPVMLLLERYKTSPGMYSVPLTNNLNF